MSIENNVAKIRNNIHNAAIAADRNPEDILLCAATKMNDTNAVKRAIQAGVDCCGENKVQELTAKLQENAYTGAPVHFIGHLQTNKVRMVVGKVDLIQSVDSLRLLEAIGPFQRLAFHVKHGLRNPVADNLQNDGQDQQKNGKQQQCDDNADDTQQQRLQQLIRQRFIGEICQHSCRGIGQLRGKGLGGQHAQQGGNGSCTNGDQSAPQTLPVAGG